MCSASASWTTDHWLAKYMLGRTHTNATPMGTKALVVNLCAQEQRRETLGFGARVVDEHLYAATKSGKFKRKSLRLSARVLAVYLCATCKKGTPRS